MRKRVETRFEYMCLSTNLLLLLSWHIVPTGRKLASQLSVSLALPHLLPEIFLS